MRRCSERMPEPADLIKPLARPGRNLLDHICCTALDHSVHLQKPTCNCNEHRNLSAAQDPTTCVHARTLPPPRPPVLNGHVSSLPPVLTGRVATPSLIEELPRPKLGLRRRGANGAGGGARASNMFMYRCSSLITKERSNACTCAQRLRVRSLPRAPKGGPLGFPGSGRAVVCARGFARTDSSKAACPFSTG